MVPWRVLGDDMVIKTDGLVLYYLVDGPPRGVVCEELLIVPLDTQLLPDGVLRWH